MSLWEYINYNFRDRRDRWMLGLVFFLIALSVPSLNLPAQQTATVGIHLEGDSEFLAVHQGMAIRASGSCTSPSLTVAEASSLEAASAEDVSNDLQCLPGTSSTKTGSLNQKVSLLSASSVTWSEVAVSASLGSIAGTTGGFLLGWVLGDLVGGEGASLGAQLILGPSFGTVGTTAGARRAVREEGASLPLAQAVSAGIMGAVGGIGGGWALHTLTGGSLPGIILGFGLGQGLVASVLATGMAQ